MKYGIIFTGYECIEYVERAIAPWIARRGDNLLICAVSVPFIGFDCVDDGTTAYLKQLRKDGKIDCLIESPTPIKETEARGAALKWLSERGVDFVWQHDADEIITDSQIAKIMKFVERQSLVDCFKLSLRNFIFDEKHYLAEPFQPMRIHRVSTWFGFRAVSFWDDNNILYRKDNEDKKDTSFGILTIPPTLAWITHYTWLNNERSRKKVAYQTARGWQSSYRWGEKGLEFNPAYFSRNNLPLPEIEELT